MLRFLHPDIVESFPCPFESSRTWSEEMERTSSMRLRKSFLSTRKGATALGRIGLSFASRINCLESLKATLSRRMRSASSAILSN